MVGATDEHDAFRRLFLFPLRVVVSVRRGLGNKDSCTEEERGGNVGIS